MGGCAAPKSPGAELQRWLLQENVPVAGQLLVDTVDRTFQIWHTCVATDKAPTPVPEAIDGLTGRVGLRIGAFGRLVLQVEVRALVFRGRPPVPPRPGDPDARPRSLIWRDARQCDLSSLRPLLVKPAGRTA